MSARERRDGSNMQKPVSLEIFEGAKNVDVLSFFGSHPFSALDLFTSHICRRAASSANARTSMHIVCFEHDSVFWKKRLGENIQESRCFFHDFTDDPFGWDSDKPLLSSSNILDRISESASSSNAFDHHLVVLDSTTSLLLCLSVTELASLLAQIPKRICDRGKPDCRTSLVFLHHTDLLDHHAERVLRALSGSCITLTSVSFNKAEQQECLCQINHQQHQESHKKQTERITISRDWKTSYDIVNNSRGGSSGKHAASPRDTETDPTAKLSFNLRLTEHEKAARSQVLLPHTKGGGVIYYEPDEADDIDYEDPDE